MSLAVSVSYVPMIIILRLPVKMFHLVTDAIAEITAQGIQTAAGEFIEADVIIFGTGFAGPEL